MHFSDYAIHDGVNLLKKIGWEVSGSIYTTAILPGTLMDLFSWINSI